MSEWDQRELCPDGGCTGVIAANGACSVCGKRGQARPVVDAAEGADASGAALRGGANDFDEDDEYYYEDDDEESDDSDDGDDDDEGDAEADEEGVATTGWTDRKLCPDGGCVGLIGDNGTCKVCGRSAG